MPMQRLVLLFSFLLLSLTGCLSSSPNEDTIAVEQASTSRIANHTKGWITADTQPRVVLTEAPSSPSASGDEVPQSVFSITPDTAGTATWQSATTIVWQPDETLTSDTTYTGTVHLSALDPNWTEGDFTFEFRVIAQSLTLEVVGLEASAVSGEQHLSGVIRTEDRAEAEAVETTLSWSYPNGSPSVSWEHDDTNTVHRFQLNGLVRGDDSTELTLTVNGDALGIESVQNETISIPALDAFGLSGARAVLDGDRYIELRFTDTLEAKQDVRGLIRVGNIGGLSFTVEGSTVRIYRNAPWNGSLTVSIEGLRNARGKQLPAPINVDVSFEPKKPGVRFVGKGTTLTHGHNAIFPVETINLRSVILTATRISPDRVPQFLQVNPIEGNEEIYRVGRDVWRQRIDLEASAESRDQWVSVGVDLSALVKEQPAGLYRLEAKFERGDIDYPCAEEVAAPGPLPPIGDTELPQESSYWDNWGGDYWEMYERRHDPCMPGYYNAYYDHDIVETRTVQLTEIGLMAKRGKDNTLWVSVTDLTDTGPSWGVTVEVLDAQLNVMDVAETDENGWAELQTPRTPLLVRAVDGPYINWLKLDNGSALSTSHFDTSGVALAKGLEGFFYTERGVWRPGDAVHLMFLLRDPIDALPGGHPVHFELRDARGQRVTRRTLTESVDGFYSLNFTTRPDAPTGTYLATVRVGGQSFDHPLRIETVRPNRLKIELDVPETLVGSSPTMEGSIGAQWLHGAPSPNLAFSMSAEFKETSTSFSRYGDYTFNDPISRFSTQYMDILEGTLDTSGNQDFEVALGTLEEPPGHIRAKIQTRVFEPSGAASISEDVITIAPHEQFVGVRTPKGDAARGMLLTDTDHPIDVVLIDADGEPVDSGEVELALYKVKWRWWWEAGSDNLSDYVGQDSYDALKRETVQVKDGKATWSLNVQYPSWGRYLLTARDKNGTHRAGKVLYIDWPGWAGRAQADNPGGAAVLSVTSSTKEVQQGEPVTVNFPLSSDARALVSIESGTQVLHSAWVEESTANTASYTFQTDPSMTPNIYAHVTVIQPASVSKNDLPIRLYGITPINVTDPATRLEPRIATEEVWEPRSDVDVRVTESSGRPMTYTLAVVDEGLLGLTRHATPDPWEAFNARRALGVQTWDVFDRIIGHNGGRFDRSLSVGGGGSADDAPPAKANRFPPMVEFLGPFELAADAEAKHTIELPAYIGEVRVMVVAAKDTASGSADRSVPVRKPLMVLSSLPRRVAPLETLKLPVSIFGLEENLGEINVSASTTGPVKLVGSAERSVTMNTPGDKMITFDLEIGEGTGLGTVRVEATNGKETAFQSTQIDVSHVSAPITKTTKQVVDGGALFEVDLDSYGLDGTQRVFVEASSTPPLDLNRRLEGLLRYPHGCLEQTTSAAMPQLYLAELVDLDDAQQTHLQRNLMAAIKRLAVFQTTSGGLSLWPNRRGEQPWGTTYAGIFLLEAERQGFLWPDGMRDPWVDYQREMADRWNSGNERADLNQAYRLYSLALAGAPAMGAMNRLRSNKISAPARWVLGMAYAKAGHIEVGRTIVEDAGTTVAPYRELAGTFGTHLRDEALILEAMIALNITPDAQRAAAEKISEALGSSQGLSTQTTAQLLRALSLFTLEQSASSPAITVAVDRGSEKELRSASGHAVVRTQLDPQDTVGAQQLSVRNTSNAPLYIYVTQTAIPRPGETPRARDGIEMTVEYSLPNGTPVDPSAITHGQDILANITVRNPQKRPLKELALTLGAASGWEFLEMGTGGGAKMNHLDVRDASVSIYFELNREEDVTFPFRINASFEGRYQLPSIQLEAMYDAKIRATEPGGWVTVRAPSSTI